MSETLQDLVQQGLDERCAHRGVTDQEAIENRPIDQIEHDIEVGVWPYAAFVGLTTQVTLMP